MKCEKTILNKIFDKTDLNSCFPFSSKRIIKFLNAFQNIKIVPIAIIVFSLFYSGCFQSKNQDTVTTATYIVDAPYPEKSALCLTNSSDYASTFAMKVNNNFYVSEQEIVDQVRNMAGNNEDSLYFYAWEFICDKSVAAEAPIHKKRALTLTLFFNTLGSEQCGRRALYLNKLWNLLGYQTRRWDMGGTIVPEVYYDSAWHMLDPMHEVFYLNENNEIAGVEELMKKPELLPSPGKNQAKIKYSSLHDYKTPLLKTTHDNKVIVNDGIIFNGPDSMLLTLPPGAKLIFPGIFTKKINSHSRYFANCKLIIPADWEGRLPNGLMIAEITGQGIISIDNIEYQIGDKTLDSLFLKDERFIEEITIGPHTQPIEIIYIMNPIMCEIKKQNTITLCGKNIQGIKISSSNIPDSISVVKNLEKKYFFLKKQRYELLKSNFLSYSPCVNSASVATVAKLLHTMEAYYLCKYNNDKKDYISGVIQNIEAALNALPNAGSHDKLMVFINNLPAGYLELFYYDMEFSDKKAKEVFLKKMCAPLKAD